MSKKDYYEILGVARTATDDEIKKKYRQLAMKHHPDRNQDVASSEEKFKEVKEAYEILSNSQLRAQYDVHGHNTPSQFSNYNTYTMDDVLKSFYTGDNLFRHQKKQIYLIHITLEECYTGKQIIIDSNQIYIPSGIPNGSEITYKDKIYRIDVRPHYKFNRINNDLLIEVSINAFEAMTGIDAVITHLDNRKLEFKIPAGIQPGQIIKLSGMGLSFNLQKGDLLIKISVLIPKVLTDIQKNTIKQFQSRSIINI